MSAVCTLTIEHRCIKVPPGFEHLGLMRNVDGVKLPQPNPDAADVSSCRKIGRMLDVSVATARTALPGTVRKTHAPRTAVTD